MDVTLRRKTRQVGAEHNPSPPQAKDHARFCAFPPWRVPRKTASMALMSWLTNLVRPKFRALVGGAKDIPDNLWDKCPGCGAMLFKRELEEHSNVCRHCGHHMPLDPVRRLALLLDEGYTLVSLPAVTVDPLRFKDHKRYADRLRDAQRRTGRHDALLVGEGTLGGHPAVVAALDFSFLGGSMGMAVGEGLVAAAERAVATRSALIVVPSSGGARMQEGMFSLIQMPRSIVAATQVKEAGLPYIVVLTDPTTGGVTASFAMLGDVHLAEKGARIGFAGARVIQSTIRETLPPGFQRAEYLLEHGMVDAVVTRAELKDSLANLLGLLRPRPSRRPRLSLLSGPVPHGARNSVSPDAASRART